MKNEEIFVIAEIGKNFIQSQEERSVFEYIKNAKKLIDAAIYAGVDAVKFQTHEVEDEQLDINVVSPHFKGSDRYSWVKRNTLGTPFEFWQEIKNYCDQNKITFFSTPMSRKAAIKLNQFNVPMWKIGSGDVDDFVMLDYIVRTGKPVIISSGMVSLSELDDVVNYLEKNEVKTTLLYCISLYPCPPEQFNLATIEYFREKYPKVRVGFSDHSLGFEAVLSAIKLGARVIEKHFSLSRNFWGSDHKVSMEPEEMKKMVAEIRDKKFESVSADLYFGSKEKELQGASNIFRKYFKKGLVAGRDIKSGTVLTPEMIYAMRPREYIESLGGLASSEFFNLVGKKIKTDLKKYEPLSRNIIY